MIEQYKERHPIQTVEIIYNFFQKNENFEIKIPTVVYNMEAGLHWCTIELYYKNQLYLCANGKGISEEYCLASGFGELFERFCSKIYIYNNYIACLKLSEYVSEKQTKDYSSILNNKFIREFLERNQIKELKDTLLMFDNFLFMEDFYNLNDGSKLSLPIKLIYKISSTTGLSAGNTLEESLVQGCSELCERYALGQIFIQNQIQYHQIPIETINDVNNIKIISQILENKNNDLLIFDLSYNFNLPVCLVLLVNKANKKINFKLGSFPDFDIALERCLTELYQGNYNSFDDIPFPIIPLRNNDIYKEIPRTIMGLHQNLSFPEHILFNKTIEKHYNSAFYISNKNVKNEELLKYYKILFKDNNINIFWRQTSPKDFTDMYATQVFSPDLIVYNDHLQQNTLSITDKQKLFQESKEIKTIVQNIILNNFSEINITELCNYDYDLLSNVFTVDPLSIYPNRDCPFFLALSFIYNDVNFPFQMLQTPKYDKLLDLYIVHQYLKNNNYTLEEIYVLTNYLNININNITNEKIINTDIFAKYKNDYQNFNILDFLV